MKALTMTCILIAAAASANAKDITLDDCPQPVRETIQSNLRGGAIDEIESHGIDGKTLYVAEIDLADKRDLKLHVSADGTLLKTREEIALANVPEAVRKSVDAKTGDGKVDDVDREQVGETVSYHVEIDRKDQPDLNLVIAKDGRIVSETGDRD